jgi:hypothetical protein
LYSIFILRAIAGIAGGLIANNKGRDKYLWAISCFIFPPAVFVIWLLKPKFSPGKTKKCPHCSGIIYRSDSVCRYCNNELPIELVQCSNCGSFVPDKDFCSQCSRKLKT